MTDTKMQKIKFMLEEFGQQDIWNKNDFNKGLYDGLEIAIAILEDRTANCRVYKDGGYTVDFEDTDAYVDDQDD